MCIRGLRFVIAGETAFPYMEVTSPVLRLALQPLSLQLPTLHIWS